MSNFFPALWVEPAFQNAGLCQHVAEHMKKISAGCVVQVIMATNRADTLDPALLRPGRLDRKIEFPMPDRRQKRLVFQVSSFSCPCHR